MSIQIWIILFLKKPLQGGFELQACAQVDGQGLVGLYAFDVIFLATEYPRISDCRGYQLKGTEYLDTRQ
jgi:hypothetical protein